MRVVGLLAAAETLRDIVGEQFHGSASGFDIENGRADVDKNKVHHTFIAGKNITLDSCVMSDSFIGVDTIRRVFTKAFLEELLDLRDTSGTANEDYLVDVFLLPVGILVNLLDSLHGLAEQIHVQFLELGAG